jgi:hypothetical protein
MVFVPVSVNICTLFKFPRPTSVLNDGTPTAIVVDAEPVTVSKIFNDPVPAAVVTTSVAVVALVTF